MPDWKGQTLAPGEVSRAGRSRCVIATPLADLPGSGPPIKLPLHILVESVKSRRATCHALIISPIRDIESFICPGLSEVQ